jgi:hypothetical protein
MKQIHITINVDDASEPTVTAQKTFRRLVGIQTGFLNGATTDCPVTTLSSNDLILDGTGLGVCNVSAIRVNPTNYVASNISNTFNSDSVSEWSFNLTGSGPSPIGLDDQAGDLLTDLILTVVVDNCNDSPVFACSLDNNTNGP